MEKFIDRDYREYTEEDIAEIFRLTTQDPSLLSTLNVNKLLDTLENKSNAFLENKTMKIVVEEIFTAINTLPIGSETMEGMCKKLAEYRLVDDIRELHKGKFVRWINRTAPAKLNNGGIVVDILFKDNGTHVRCKNAMNRFIQFKFDECLTFQKMNLEEQLILMSYEQIA